MRTEPRPKSPNALLITGNETPAIDSAALGRLLKRYERWLGRHPLSAHTRRAYLGNVARFLDWLAASTLDGDPLTDPHARDYAVRDFKAYLKRRGRAKPASVNLALAAADSFYSFLGLGPAKVKREDLPQQAPRALDPEEQRRFLRAVEREADSRNRAVALLLFYAGLRLGEVAALDLDDVSLTARKGRVTVRSGKGETYREVPLNPEVRDALQAWTDKRRSRLGGGAEAAFFLSRTGGRLGSRSIDNIVRRLGAEAGIALSPHVLRHTCVTNLIRSGADVILVAELAGHRRLETTRRYSLPTAVDRNAAMERIRIEY